MPRHTNQSSLPRPLPQKVCASCGRSFAWRKRWATTWESVRYCSDACRGQRLEHRDVALEQRILASCKRQGVRVTFCPMLACRKDIEPGRLHESGRHHEPDPQRHQAAPEHEERIRRACRRLSWSGHLELLQGGRVVSPDPCRGTFLVRWTGQAIDPSRTPDGADRTHTIKR